MAVTIYPVILSGGIGSRLWPVSREKYPKQLLALHGEQTLLQQTVARVTGTKFAAPLVMCNEAHRFMIAEQLREMAITPHAIILEPVGRNTAPAAAVAAEVIRQHDPSGLMLLLPADHIISNKTAFTKAITQAAKTATKGHLVTFGITPTAPETGYGYIKSSKKTVTSSDVPLIESFVEKPSLSKAKRYVKSGDYYWNSGMFLFSASQYLEELKTLQPAIASATEKAINLAQSDLDFLRLDKTAFAKSPNISIDYAVMEHTQHAAVVPVNMGWSDVGSWSALWELGKKDKADNVTHGHTLLHNASGNYVRSDKILTGLVGVDNLVVVVTDDAVLVAHKDQSQDVKTLVDLLKKHKRDELENHRKVYRPWGYYDSLYTGDRTQVKELHIKPGAKLSLQKHFHRAEHWVVISGTARVTRDDQHIEVSENESVFVPRGSVHRIENPGKVDLKVIEVQSGEYLGEDDIVRMEDDFGRA